MPILRDFAHYTLNTGHSYIKPLAPDRKAMQALADIAPDEKTRTLPAPCENWTVMAGGTELGGVFIISKETTPMVICTYCAEQTYAWRFGAMYFLSLDSSGV